MPYLKPERIAEIQGGQVPMEQLTPGDLNFLITSLVMAYAGSHDHSYETLNQIVGAMDCAKLEFVRRVVYPYETTRAHENGDVYARLFGEPSKIVTATEIPK